MDGTPFALPIVAIELKLSGSLETAEFDKKGAVYGAIKDEYPCVLTCLVLGSNDRRRMKEETMLRNGRKFDRLITDWNEEGQHVLRESICAHLDYAVGYWAR